MIEEVETDTLQRIVERCNDCKFATCEQCEINWCEVQAIKKLLEKNKELEDKINKALDKLENEPYVAYTFYGDILHESDEIINILKGE